MKAKGSETRCSQEQKVREIPVVGESSVRARGQFQVRWKDEGCSHILRCNSRTDVQGCGMGQSTNRGDFHKILFPGLRKYHLAQKT